MIAFDQRRQYLHAASGLGNYAGVGADFGEKVARILLLHAGLRLGAVFAADERWRETRGRARSNARLTAPPRRRPGSDLRISRIEPTHEPSRPVPQLSSDPLQFACPLKSRRAAIPKLWPSPSHAPSIQSSTAWRTPLAGSDRPLECVCSSCTTRSTVASRPIRGRCSGEAAAALPEVFFGVGFDDARFEVRFEVRTLRFVFRGLHGRGSRRAWRGVVRIARGIRKLRVNSQKR